MTRFSERWIFFTLEISLCYRHESVSKLKGTLALAYNSMIDWILVASRYSSWKGRSQCGQPCSWLFYSLKSPSQREIHAACCVSNWHFVIRGFLEVRQHCERSSSIAVNLAASFAKPISVLAKILWLNLMTAFRNYSMDPFSLHYAHMELRYLAWKTM